MAKTKPPVKTAGSEYVVLRLAEIREEPVEENPITERAWLPVLEQVEGGWQTKVVSAASREQAIRLHVGEGADVLEGTWKAVPLSSWKGGIVTKRVMQAERVPLEDL